MKSIKKRTLRTWSRRIISFVLIISMMLTLIPESVYASKKKTVNNNEVSYTYGDFDITFEKKSSPSELG